jgi:hypothetical protein
MDNAKRVAHMPTPAARRASGDAPETVPLSSEMSSRRFSRFVM